MQTTDVAHLLKLLSEPQMAPVALCYDPDGPESESFYIDLGGIEEEEDRAATPEAAFVRALRREADAWENGDHDVCIPRDEQTDEEKAATADYVIRLRAAADALEVAK